MLSLNEKHVTWLYHMNKICLKLVKANAVVLKLPHFVPDTY